MTHKNRVEINPNFAGKEGINVVKLAAQGKAFWPKEQQTSLGG